MGHSFTRYREAGFWCSDGTLCIWLATLVDAIDAFPDTEDWLREARTDWWKQASLGLTGMISADLDEVCSTDAHAARVIEAALDALDALATRAAIPAQELQRRGIGGEMEGLRDQPTGRALRVGRLFVALLEGRVRDRADRRAQARETAAYIHDDAAVDPPDALVRPRAR